MSCAEPPTGPGSSESIAATPVPTSAALVVGCAKGTFEGGNFVAHWDCQQIVKLRATTQYLQDKLGAPVGAWNSAIQATGVSGPPTFATTTSPNEASATVTGVSGGSAFCGDWHPELDTLFIANESDQTCLNQVNHGPIDSILVHEMGHVWGWKGGFYTGHSQGVVGASDQCTLALPTSGPPNKTICAHDVEGGLAGYGMRDFSGQNFWATPFVTDHDGPRSFSTVNLIEGEKDTLVLGSFVKEQGGTVASQHWATPSSNPSVATMFGGIITAIDSGSTTITIAPSTGTGYFLTSAFLASSRTVQVNVTPQAPAPLVVQDITTNAPSPITASNVYDWTAVLGSGDPTGITFRWVFEYSYSSPPDSVFIPGRYPGDNVSPWIHPFPPDTIYTGAGKVQSQLVPSGDYTIWVKVWPIRDGVAGSPAAREFSVCTSVGGGGNNLLAAPDRRLFPFAPPPPGTDAVGGCSS